MLMRLKKVPDGVVLSLVRAGAPTAIQRTGHAGFFAHHDLMHYTVETTLGLQRAFLGLMARGWDFSTFGDRADPRYQQLPWEAIYAERWVDLMMRSFRDPAWRDEQLRPLWLEDVMSQTAGLYNEVPPGTPRVTDTQILAICTTFDDLLKRWAAIPPGGHLELTVALGAL